MEARKERSCGCIIESQGEVLLVCGRKSGAWAMPKGHVEPGESDEQTALREVREEVGLEVEIIPGPSYSLSYMLGSGAEKTVRLFPARTESRALTPQEKELREARWCSFGEALRILRSEGWKDVLRQYMTDRGIALPAAAEGEDGK